MYKVEKNRKKRLTNKNKSAIICKLSTSGHAEGATTKKDFEIFQKTFKKPLDKVEEMWYNTEAVRESDSESIIEN